MSIDLELIPCKICEAINAISSVQAFLLKKNQGIAVYALESAYQNIEEVQKLIENGDLVTRQKVADYAMYFEKYQDTASDFTAEQFLIDFDGFGGDE